MQISFPLLYLVRYFPSSLTLAVCFARLSLSGCMFLGVVFYSISFLGSVFSHLKGKKPCTCHKLHACPRLTQEMCGSASGAKSPCFQVEFWPVCYVRFISQIILNSMHKYQPRFHVILDESEKGNSRASLHETNKDHLRTFIFPETQFMAVTAYQNHMVSFFLFC